MLPLRAWYTLMNVVTFEALLRVLLRAASASRRSGQYVSTPLDSKNPRRPLAVAARAAILLVFWFMISGGSEADIVVGLAAVAAATWVSVRLLPARGRGVRPLLFAVLVLHVLRQSAVAAMDVARRALDPAVPLRPGFVTVPLRLPVGRARSAFCALSSLMPGTLPAGADGNDALSVHCLDVEQPVASDMAAEEALFTRALAQ
jgi:multicomponent Na+:H+ antiporter subunit E